MFLPSMCLAEYDDKSTMKGAHLKSGWINKALIAMWAFEHSFNTTKNSHHAMLTLVGGRSTFGSIAISGDLVMCRLIPFCPLKYTLFATWPYATACN